MPTAPYGSWKSPITPSMITSRGVSLTSIATSGPQLYWLESRPLEQGRGVIVQANDEAIDRTPSEMNVRTTVHEYGGGSFCVHDETIYFVNFSDQRLYRQDGDACRPGTV